MREHHPARVGSGNCSVLRKPYAHGLDQRRHRRGRTHGHAMAPRTAHSGFRVEEFLERHFPCAYRLTELPQAGAGTHVLTTYLAVQHRPSRHYDGRQIAARVVGQFEIAGRVDFGSTASSKATISSTFQT